jgi:hypothetical protein
VGVGRQSHQKRHLNVRPGGGGCRESKTLKALLKKELSNHFYVHTVSNDLFG